MSRKLIFYAGFFVVLVLIFFLGLKRMVPGFTESRFPPIGVVNDFAFIDQDGKKVTNRDVEGKVFVAEYFFTTCKGICPRMNNNMRRVYENYKNTDGFLILSHTCDPETDSVSRLRKYADSMQVNTDKWIFLTGRKDSLYNMARFSYRIDDPKNNVQRIEDDFLHTQFWALVDRKGNIRKIYDGLKQNEISQLIRDIGKMLDEKN